MILIKNGLVICNSKAKPKRQHIWIDKGRIVQLSSKLPQDITAFSKVIDAEGKLVAPGLINAHTHSYANYFKTAADQLPLEEMMFFITAEGQCLEPEDVYYNTLLGGMEMIKGGITSCLDQLAQSRQGLDSAMEAYEDLGIRATIAPMISDIPYYETLPIAKRLAPKDYTGNLAQAAEELLQTNVDFLEKWHNKQNRLQVGFGPSGPQRCSVQLLQQAMEYAKKYDTIFHTHTLETRTQKNTAHYLFGKSMVQFLADIGCLNERTSMAHGVWLTAKDIALAASKGSAVAHCPSCNLYLGSGIAPVNLFRELGLTVGLGTDGANGGCNQSMLETMKFAGMLHRANELQGDKWLSAQETWRMATENNAKILGLQNEIGTIEIGKRADIVIYNPQNSMALQPLDEPVMQLAFGETGSGVETVLVEGRVVLEDNHFVTIDEAKMLTKIQHHGQLVRARLQQKIPRVLEEVAYMQQVLPRDF